MSKYFSPSMGCFYDSKIHGPRLPADAVALTDQRHADLLAAQASGGFIVSGADGKPIVVQHRVNTDDVLVRIKSIRDHRTQHGGALVDNRWYHTDRDSAVRYKYLADKAIDDGGIDGSLIRAAWRPMDVDSLGTIDLTYGLLRRIMHACLEQALAIDAAAERHRAALLDSEDPSTYDYSVGWPLAFFDLSTAPTEVL